MPVYLWAVITASAAVLAVAAVILLRRYLHHLVDRRIAAYQNDLVTRHVEEVENIYRQMRGWRHDYHNHIQTMQAFRAGNQNEKLDEYLVKLNADLTSVDTLIKSGNVMVDAILNSKLSLAKIRGIAVNAKAVVPKELTLSEIDLCVVIGNLLDNAIEANLRIGDKEKRFIRVYIDLKGDHLYLSVTNASANRAQKANGRFVSAKGGANHGFGLMRVDRIIGKYEGYLKSRTEEGAFTSEVLLPR